MSELIYFGIAIWIVGIPVALGFFFKGWWPKTKSEFWASPVGLWFGGVFWPLALVIFFGVLTLQGLWLLVTLIVRRLFRLGGWFRRFLPGPRS